LNDKIKDFIKNQTIYKNKINERDRRTKQTNIKSERRFLTSDYLTKI
jgi:hypothetical protein